MKCFLVPETEAVVVTAIWVGKTHVYNAMAKRKLVPIAVAE